MTSIINRLRAHSIYASAILATLLSGGAFAQSDKVNQLNMSPGVTSAGQAIYDLHMVILWICVVIGVLVFGVMLYSIIYHRKSRGFKASNFHESTKVEIAWTVVPFLILIGMAVPATSTLIHVYDTDDAEMDILVTGYQWKWKYEYLNENGDNVSFFSNLRTPQSEVYNSEEKGEHYLLEVDEPVVIPVDTKVRLLVTANDVIHSWWVPDFAVKKDAIPGFVHEAWAVVEEPGIYRGKCTELCGKDHGFMPIVVKAVEQAEYESWLAMKQQEALQVYETVGKTWTMAELMETGEQVYAQACQSCHQANGQGIPPAFPSLVGQGLAIGPIDAHIDIVVNGKAGSAMQAFAAQLNPAEIAAVVTYERNAWGNNVGDLVQPRAVNALISSEE